MQITPCIRLEGVAQKKGSFTLHADGEFAVGVHLITGPVGSGKTSLGEILAGIQKPDQGSIHWNGTRRVMLLQDTSYHISTMTVKEEAASGMVTGHGLSRWQVLPEKRILICSPYPEENFAGSNLRQFSPVGLTLSSWMSLMPVLT